VVALKSIDGRSREEIALPLMNSQRSSPCEKKLRHEAEQGVYIYTAIYIYMRELPTTPSYFSIHPVLKNPFLLLLLCWLLLFLLLLCILFIFPSA